MEIGQRIRNARKQAGLTQSQLAELSGVASISIHQYEAGKRRPQLEQLMHLATALGVPLEQLTGVSDSMRASGVVMAELRPAPKARIKAAVEQMTPTGQSRVADFAEDILPKYRRPGLSEAVESTSAPIEGQSTTPPPDAPETPSEGE